MLRTIKNIPIRAVKATIYSLAGLKSAFTKEEAFKLETLAFAALFLIMLAVPWPFWKKAALLAIYLIIPLCELFNSAIEDICDLITRDFHENIKSAKDKGSAAVLTAIVINLLALCALIAI
ncbi:diacylglycerol kinase [Deltaproteobacteria bacterium Smac51]|nr:diacylglycerol kinase [Deltaproteobacteria bacterium Smac51]